MLEEVIFSCNELSTFLIPLEKMYKNAYWIQHEEIKNFAQKVYKSSLITSFSLFWSRRTT